MNRELFDECVETLVGAEAVESSDSFGASPDKGLLTPVTIGVLKAWLLKKLRDIGCEQKEAIKEAATMAVDSVIKNPFVKNLCIEVISTAIDAACE